MKINDALRYNRIIKDIIDNATDVNALVKFRLLGILKQCEPIVEDFETVRNDLIRKYGKLEEDGNYGVFLPKRDDYEDDDSYNKAVEEYEQIINKLNDELKKVADSELDVKIQKFKYTDIMDSGLPTDYMLALYDLIEE